MLLGQLALAALGLVVVAVLLNGAALATEWMIGQIRRRKSARHARYEAELDRKQLELRHAILRLATELGEDASSARMALVREAYLVRGEVPND